MAGRNWKRQAATSLPHALELSIEYARAKNNRSVDQIAELIGLANKFTLYKWIESGKIPAISIRPFEHACGCDFVTRYLAHSAHKLLIDIPLGQCAGAEELQRLTGTCHAAVGALIDFHKGARTPEETIANITVAMEDLAWHRLNVEKHAQPELDLDQ